MCVRGNIASPSRVPRPEPRTHVSGCNAGRTAVREKVEHSVKLKPALNVPKTPEDIGNGKTSALDHSLQCANRFSAGIVHLTFTLRTISDNAVMHEMGKGSWKTSARASPDATTGRSGTAGTDAGKPPAVEHAQELSHGSVCRGGTRRGSPGSAPPTDSSGTHLHVRADPTAPPFPARLVLGRNSNAEALMLRMENWGKREKEKKYNQKTEWKKFSF